MKHALIIVVSLIAMPSFATISQQSRDRFKTMSKFDSASAKEFFKSKKIRCATLHVKTHKSDIITATTAKQAGRFACFATTIIEDGLEEDHDGLCMIYAINNSALCNQFEKFLSSISKDEDVECYVQVEKPFVDFFKISERINACWLRNFLNKEDYEELKKKQSGPQKNISISEKPEKLVPSKLSPIMFKNTRPATGAVLRAEISLGDSYYGKFDGKEGQYWSIDVRAKNDDWSSGEFFYGYVKKTAPIAKQLLSKVEDGKFHKCLVKLIPIADPNYKDFVSIEAVEFLDQE